MFLLHLLWQFNGNEDLKECEWYLFLLQFQKTYPDIYAERFQLSNSKTTDPLNSKPGQSKPVMSQNRKVGHTKLVMSQDPKAALPPKPKLKQPLLKKPLLKLKGLRIWLGEKSSSWQRHSSKAHKIWLGKESSNWHLSKADRNWFDMMWTSDND